jgi:phage anti-repressor protein
MKSCYLYSFYKEVQVKDKGVQMQNHVVVFFPYKTHTEIELQLRSYFNNNTLPDQLIVICLDFNKNTIGQLFEKKSSIYNYIPKFQCDADNSNICVISLDKQGNFTSVIGNCPTEKNIDEIYNRGLIKIFAKNGGLIVSQTANHFVFPSGKHSNRFLRTGNVLINGNEIFFIASALVRYFKKSKFETLYSDTSSINSLALAYISLLKELNPEFTESVLIESFGSYTMFEKLKFKARRDTVFLVSSSTSGSILKRMTDEENRSNNIDLTNIAIIYGLNVKQPYNAQVLCDLTLDHKNNDSLEPIKSYNVKKGEVCQFCIDGSKALKVEGDVFLLEKPIVSTYLVKQTDLPLYLKNYSAYYKKENSDSEPIIRCYHKDKSYSSKKYEIYIDLLKILEEWDNRNTKNHPYSNIFIKLEKYILQNIPASLKYIIVLPDEGSLKLAEIILQLLNEHGQSITNDKILKIDNEEIKSKIDKSKKGSIAIVSSSIVTGRNLLYLSRALRDYESTYQRFFFTFVNRTNNNEQYEFLESNLSLGEFGKNTHKIFNVEKIHCSSESQQTPWHIEEDFIKILEEYFENFEEYKIIRKYCLERSQALAESGKVKGLSNNLFFPSLKNKILKIRTGFAFAPFPSGSQHNNFITRSKQSEIYFIIGSILNELRNKNIFKQSEYVRNLIDPGNFVRYNDGIIQACFLRAAKNAELDYSLSEDDSIKMKSILGDMILHLNDDHAEALNEFLYAIAIKKLRMTPGTIEDCVELLKKQDYYINNDSILKALVHYIEEKVFTQNTIEEKFKNLIPVVISDDD